MTDILKALLGDSAAQERITEIGVLLPCPFCGGEACVRNVNGSDAKWVSCKVCLCDGETSCSEKGARCNWNTRTSFLTPEQIKRLEEIQ